MWVADHFYLISQGSVKLQLVTLVWNSVNHLINFHANLFLIWEFVFNTYFSCDIVCKSCVAYRFFFTRQGHRGASRCHQRRPGTRHRGAAPQRAGARARTRAGALPSWESHQPSYAWSANRYRIIICPCVLQSLDETYRKALNPYGKATDTL